MIMHGSSKSGSPAAGPESEAGVGLYYGNQGRATPRIEEKEACPTMAHVRVLARPLRAAGVLSMHHIERR